jgi:hypothetical protein
MPADTIIALEDIPVMYVMGEKGRPIGEQAPKAFQELESKLPSLQGRKFYGVVFAGCEYRACVALAESDDPTSLPFTTWVIPGGKYARRKIENWEEHIDSIGPTFDSLRRENKFDPDRPDIEFYRSQRELLVMVPVK